MKAALWVVTVQPLDAVLINKLQHTDLWEKAVAWFNHMVAVLIILWQQGDWNSKVNKSMHEIFNDNNKNYIFGCMNR